MILKKNIITAISDGQDAIDLELAIALGFTQVWIVRLALKNKKNGPLTTPNALRVIREKTGLGDNEILEEVATESATK